MRLDLRNIIGVPGGAVPFAFQLDLSHLDFFGTRPITKPVEVRGEVQNHAGALELKGEAFTTLDLVCDRCGKEFTREKAVPLSSLLATKLEGEDDDEILLLDSGVLDLGEFATSAFVLDMDSKNLCAEDCKGICAGCGADLNTEPCRCRHEVDPRLAALAQLLDK